MKYLWFLVFKQNMGAWQVQTKNSANVSRFKNLKELYFIRPYLIPFPEKKNHRSANLQILFQRFPNIFYRLYINHPTSPSMRRQSAAQREFWPSLICAQWPAHVPVQFHTGIRSCPMHWIGPIDVSYRRRRLWQNSADEPSLAACAGSIIKGELTCPLTAQDLLKSPGLSKLLLKCQRR